MKSNNFLPLLAGGIVVGVGIMVLVLKCGVCQVPAPGNRADAAAAAVTYPGSGSGLPVLLDLGAKSCIPCKMMAPILADLMQNNAQQFETVFIDVWENPAAGEKYQIKTIPTQIFFDQHGKELFRHVGFYGKDEIFAKWQKLGYDFAPANAAAPDLPSEVADDSGD